MIERTPLLDTFTHALLIGELGFRELTVLAKSDNTRKLRVVPKMNLPAVLQKLSASLRPRIAG